MTESGSLDKEKTPKQNKNQRPYDLKWPKYKYVARLTSSRIRDGARVSINFKFISLR